MVCGANRIAKKNLTRQRSRRKNWGRRVIPVCARFCCASKVSPIKAASATVEVWRWSTGSVCTHDPQKKWFGASSLWTTHSRWKPVFGFRFRFSVFAISIPQLRTHAGVVASSRLMRRDLYSICFSSALHTAARPGPRPRQRVWSAVNMGNRATFKAQLVNISCKI